MSDELNFVIVGHVDHGKSTLIGRLLYDTNSLSAERIGELEAESKKRGEKLEFAFVMDHLQEERDQNITIDTAQTFFKTSKRRYVIIDTPGHKEFTKNMITGASFAEAAILIVAADDGLQEQTKRHGYLLGLLGVKQIVVLINKMDTVGYDENRFKELKDEITAFLSLIDIKPSYILPISASNGDNIVKPSENMPWFNGPSVLQTLDTFKTKKTLVDHPLRFPVQDVYKIDGKNILVGRIATGTIKQGDSITLSPSRKISTVKSIEIYQKDRTEAYAGESIGITITDPYPIERGEIISHGAVPITDEIHANVFWSSEEPLSRGAKITLKCATQEVECTIDQIKKRLDSSNLDVLEEDAEQLNDTEVGQIIVKTAKPVVIENFNDVQELGRFVFVRGYDISGSGIVTGEK